MIEASIKYAAVLLAAIVGMILGALWYSVLFGKLWMKLSGKTEKDIEEAKKKGMAKSYGLSFLGLLLMSYVFAHFIDYVEATTIRAGASAAFWLWLGFIAPVCLGVVLWEGKSWKLYALNVGHYLVVLLVMGAILAVWQ